MDTGLAVKGDGICRRVPLTLQNIKKVEDFLPLDLGSVDVILGMQWPESLCDAPFPGGPVDHRQPAENLCISYHETHT